MRSVTHCAAPEMKIEYVGASYDLYRVWMILKSHLCDVHELLLSKLIHELADIHAVTSTWREGGLDHFYWRAAIEPQPHEQGKRADWVIVDAVRDALLWVSKNAHDRFNAWLERFLTADVPILRRIAVHAMDECPDISADDRVAWLMRCVEPFESAVHHEAFHLLERHFRDAGEETQRVVVILILAHEEEDVDGIPSGQPTDRKRFNWLSWLNVIAPDCSFMHDPLREIQGKYPNWVPSEHPDYRWFMEGGGYNPTSPYSVQELLKREPASALDMFLHYKDDSFRGPNREGLLSEIRKACTQDFSWGPALAAALEAAGQWQSDLWPCIFGTWRELKLTSEVWAAISPLIAHSELYTSHPLDIAELLSACFDQDERPISEEALQGAYKTTLEMWEYVSSTPPFSESDDWYVRAIYHPAGVIVEFWLDRLEYTFRDKEAEAKYLPKEERELFERIINSDDEGAACARIMLAHYILRLYSLDAAWAKEKIICFFTSSDKDIFRQVWDGFLQGGQMAEKVAVDLEPAFLFVCEKMNWLQDEVKEKLVGYINAYVMYFAHAPLDLQIPVFFRNAEPKERSEFFRQIGYQLAKMELSGKERIWGKWLDEFLKRCASGRYGALSDDDVTEIIDWLSHLDHMYPDAVEQVVRIPIRELRDDHGLDFLRDTDLIERYPEETALLFTHVIGRMTYRYEGLWPGMIGRLAGLSAERKRSLNEALIAARLKPIP
jgi:hypothetical protein